MNVRNTMTDEFLPPVFAEVRVLPHELSNQIAAGEVVERPASAVRELVENSLDAGATRIEIELLDGGAQLIRVADNGRGMSLEDAERSIQRHATSKIATRDDLFRIASYGFRGEALPSIASVSRFELVSRTSATHEAVRIVVDGGSLKLVEPWSSPVGTTVTVKDLFYNTPARRKFLKTKNSEQRTCIQVIEDIAVPRPDVAFVLKADGRTVLNLPAVEDVWHRVADIRGYEDSKHLYPADVAEQDGVTAWGFISSPSLTARSATTSIKFFINGRAIRDRMMIAAVRQGYQTLIDRGRSPVVYLFISVPLDSLDVNVHPAKTEVRFQDQNAVFRAVRRSVFNALTSAPWVEGNQPVSAADAANVYRLPRSFAPQTAPRSKEDGPQGDLAIWSTGPTRSYSLRPAEEMQFHGEAARFEDTHSNMESEGFQQRNAQAAPASAVDEEMPVAGWFQSLHYIGPLHRLYLLLSGPAGLIVIDQHAAHERITYEYLRSTWRAREVQKQQLLVPDTISLSAQRALTLADHLDFFAELGFELEPFGDKDFILRTTPDWFGARDFQPMLIDALDDLATDGATVQIEQALDAILSRMACHGSIRSGDKVSAEEVRQLLKDLDEVDFGANCPHGRPVYLPIDLFELEGRFERR